MLGGLVTTTAPCPWCGAEVARDEVRLLGPYIARGKGIRPRTIYHTACPQCGEVIVAEPFSRLTDPPGAPLRFRWARPLYVQYAEEARRWMARGHADLAAQYARRAASRARILWPHLRRVGRG
ncbi:MAG TPA: hypothetical protein VNI83_04120 [Vicinamibacterales bacterium]|nr:hypothetical protein [Vicinamibacterales bacterium]